MTRFNCIRVERAPMHVVVPASRSAGARRRLRMSAEFERALERGEEVLATAHSHRTDVDADLVDKARLYQRRGKSRAADFQLAAFSRFETPHPPTHLRARGGRRERPLQANAKRRCVRRHSSTSRKRGFRANESRNLI